MDEDGTQTWTLYDGGNPVMDFNSSGSLTMRYLWGPMGIVARQTSGGTVSWYLADALGSVRDLVNNSGAIIDHIDFSAFGTVLDQSNPSAGDRMMGFAGMEQDAVTELNLAVFREENPGTGRWDSQDPLAFAAGDSDLYRYVGNAPTDASDPGGLDDIFTEIYEDWSQYRRLYDSGEISEWQWICIGFFRPSDVPVFQRPRLAKFFGKFGWRKGDDPFGGEEVGDLPAPLAPSPDEPEVKIAVIFVPGPLIPGPTAGLWSPGKLGDTCKNAFRHFRDHGADFGAANALDYARKARQFFLNAGADTQMITRTNGQIVLYQQSTETFAIYEADGTPVTIYKPNPAFHKYPTNQDYFKAQQW